jgi:hypothetical protein
MANNLTVYAERQQTISRWWLVLAPNDYLMEFIMHTYRLDGRFWPMDLCCAVVRHEPVSLILVSMRRDTLLPQ